MFIAAGVLYALIIAVLCSWLPRKFEEALDRLWDFIVELDEAHDGFESYTYSSDNHKSTPK